MNLDSVSVHKDAKKELGQYPAILTSHSVNNPSSLFKIPFIAGQQIYVESLLVVLFCRGVT